MREILPNLDPDEITRIISKIDLYDPRKVADNTASLGVFSFDCNGRRVFGKVSRSLGELRAAQRYMQIVGEDELLIGTAPELVGLIEDREIGLLLTYDTNNRPLIYERENLMRELGINDRFIFERALTHHRLARFITESVFVENITPPIIPFDILLERSSDPDFNKYRPEYEDLTLRFGDLELTDISLINVDPKSENIVHGVIVDCDKTQSGFTVEELARTSINSGRLFQYNLIRRELAERDERAFSPIDSTTVGILKRIQAIRTASFLFGRKRFKEAGISLS